jgi:hypothetical protein
LKKDTVESYLLIPQPLNNFYHLSAHVNYSETQTAAEGKPRESGTGRGENQKEVINHMKDKKDISNTRAIISYLAAIELRNSGVKNFLSNV